MTRAPKPIKPKLTAYVQVPHGGPSKYLFVIPGAPRTKKNHGWRTKQGKQMPSKAFTQWQKDAGYFLSVFKRHYGSSEFPLPFRVNCQAMFWRDAERGDAVGYYQALADCLEHYGIVKNDALIVSWDGSRLLKDAANPRIAVQLEVL